MQARTHHSPASRGAHRSSRLHPVVPWLLLAVDVVLVIAFAAMGNREHDSGLGISDIVQTAWPFIAGLLIGSVVTRFWRSSTRIWPEGLIVLVATVGLGMSLRVLSGTGGTELSFILVISGVLGVLLAGRRLLSRLLLRS